MKRQRPSKTKRACLSCRLAHAACTEHERPCARCKEKGLPCDQELAHKHNYLTPPIPLLTNTWLDKRQRVAPPISSTTGSHFPNTPAPEPPLSPQILGSPLSDLQLVSTPTLTFDTFNLPEELPFLDLGLTPVSPTTLSQSLPSSPPMLSLDYPTTQPVPTTSPFRGGIRSSHQTWHTFSPLAFPLEPPQSLLQTSIHAATPPLLSDAISVWLLPLGQLLQCTDGFLVLFKEMLNITHNNDDDTGRGVLFNTMVQQSYQPYTQLLAQHFSVHPSSQVEFMFVCKGEGSRPSITIKTLCVAGYSNMLEAPMLWMIHTRTDEGHRDTKPQHTLLDLVLPNCCAVKSDNNSACCGSMNAEETIQDENDSCSTFQPCWLSVLASDEHTREVLVSVAYVYQLLNLTSTISGATTTTNNNNSTTS